MTINRVPRGIPTGGQFTANQFSEPAVSLSKPSAYKPDHGISQPPGFRGARKIDGEWVPEDQVRRDRVTGEYTRVQREAAGNRRTGWGYQPDAPPSVHDRLQDAIWDVTDKIADTGEAVSASVAAAQKAPIDEKGGSFVTWNSLVPKFLRRK